MFFIIKNRFKKSLLILMVFTLFLVPFQSYKNVKAAPVASIPFTPVLSTLFEKALYFLGGTYIAKEFLETGGNIETIFNNVYDSLPVDAKFAFVNALNLVETTGELTQQIALDLHLGAIANEALIFYKAELATVSSPLLNSNLQDAINQIPDYDTWLSSSNLFYEKDILMRSLEGTHFLVRVFTNNPILGYEHIDYGSGAYGVKIWQNPTPNTHPSLSTYRVFGYVYSSPYNNAVGYDKVAKNTKEYYAGIYNYYTYTLPFPTYYPFPFDNGIEDLQEPETVPIPLGVLNPPAWPEPYDPDVPGIINPPIPGTVDPADIVDVPTSVPVDDPLNPTIPLDPSVPIDSVYDPAIPLDPSLPNIGALNPTLPTDGSALDFQPLLTTGLFQKFPFSIPYDMLLIFNIFDNTNREPLQFKLPFIQDIELEFDLSHFSGVASITRFFLYVIFLFALMYLTKKVLF